jgi:hypothetical protein
MPDATVTKYSLIVRLTTAFCQSITTSRLYTIDIIGYLRCEMQSTIELPSLAADSPQTAAKNLSMITPLLVYPRPIFNDHKIKNGKPSAVHSYCQWAINHEHKECIWLSIQHDRKWVAKDIQFGSEDKLFGICELRKLF